jgi:multidrug efflux pump subunit AcrA (membrane-fusion protein)
MRPLPANAELDLERYSSLAAKEFASRQSVDTRKALVAQYQAAIQRDEAAIDNAGVSLGYTTITSPINGRTGVRLVDLGTIVHASDSTGLVVVTQLDPIFVIFTLPQDNLPEITEAMRQGALTSRMTRMTVSSLARGASRSSTTRSTRAPAHFDLRRSFRRRPAPASHAGRCHFRVFVIGRCPRPQAQFDRGS